jgi:hypothetical protein
MRLDSFSDGIRPDLDRRGAGWWRERRTQMISTDFEIRQLLALEHREQLARDMRLARRERADGGLRFAPRVLGRAHDQIRSLARLKPSRVQPQKV